MQIKTLKKAIGTLADAVSEEFELVRKQEPSDLENKLQKLISRVDQIEFSHKQQDQDLSNVFFQIDTLRTGRATTNEG